MKHGDVCEVGLSVYGGMYVVKGVENHKCVWSVGRVDVGSC